MTLSDFIRTARADIVAHAVAFAQTLPVLSSQAIDVAILSNHLPDVLDAVVLDLEQPQTRAESIVKSEGRAVPVAWETAAQTHGRMRAEVGLSVAQVVAEYRVLRSVIVRLWFEAGASEGSAAMKDLVRFNEAIDQAIAESVAFHVAEVERWRSTLLGVIGHDLRTPLSTVLMATDTLSRLAGPGNLSAPIGLLQRGGARLTSLLDSLLEYNNASLGTAMTVYREPVDLGAACRSEIELLRSAFPGVSIGYEAAGSLAGRFDENRIREALTNLVSNAAQYRIPGTPVRVTATGEQDHVTLSVINDGEPIAPEVLETFFQPLRRRDVGQRHGPRRNLGIGLFIVREIAHAHGGEVEALAAGGTVSFVMRLPKEGVEPGRRIDR